MDYVHGYSLRETERLFAQAGTLAGLLHHDSLFSPGEKVLEAGCGVGAQTVILAQQNPATQITSLDQSADSLKQAQALIEAKHLKNVTFLQADIFDLPLAPQSFDHIFFCFVLEHLANPPKALQSLRRVLKPGGKITVIEGDHGSCFFHPESGPAHRAIQCLIDLQAQGGGNALIGRQLYPLLAQAGFLDIEVSPRMVYADASRPELVEGFTRQTFKAMVSGIREAALAQGMISAIDFDAGIQGLQRTTAPDGMFSYTFFKARGKNLLP
jgi:ubiquinone/menaquinone biosynthesis C-methylase UbiE